MAAGLNASLTLAGLNQTSGALIANAVNSLARLHAFYSQYWSATGVTDYEALGGAVADANNLNSGLQAMEQLYQVMVGNGTVANGSVTTPATGNNFTTFPYRVMGGSTN